MDSLKNGFLSTIVGFLTKRGVDQVAGKAIVASPKFKKSIKKIDALSKELEDVLGEFDLDTPTED